MFKTKESVLVDSFALKVAEGNYRIQTGDRLVLQVFGNNGELLVDPDNLMKQEMNLMNPRNNNDQLEYLVLTNGTVDFPVIGNAQVKGMTINEANAVLSGLFAKFYPNSFVYLSLVNRRVVVFGVNGGQVVPIENENMNLLEVLALSGEVKIGSYAHNIRLIRGDLHNPNVILIDLSTIDGLKQSNLAVRANDVIYVEPKKILVSQAISQSISPILAVLNTVIISIALFTP